MATDLRVIPSSAHMTVTSRSTKRKCCISSTIAFRHTRERRKSSSNVGILPQPTAEQKRDPSFVVQPRYWLREEVVESVIPKYPELLALVLQTGHRPSIQHVLTLWIAGYHLSRGNGKEAERLLDAAMRFDQDRSVKKLLDRSKDEELATTLELDFPLTELDAQAIADHLDAPDAFARELVDRFSPKWFLGWREIAARRMHAH